MSSNMNSNIDLYDQVLSYRRNRAPFLILAQPWFVKVPYPVYYPRRRCLIEPLICGEDVFGKIAKDLKNARHSVDIITWGFDPGMVLVRGATTEAGQRYGDLLKEIAMNKEHPVKVRLLIWHDDLISQDFMKNNPGYYGQHFPNVGCAAGGYYDETHQNYNAEWYAQVCGGEIQNIHLHVRHISSNWLRKSLSGESEPSKFGIKGKMAEIWATHHQKMLLIDYESPASAIGYVMGHNSITDFWDTKQHLFRDPKRERFYSANHVKLQRQAWEQSPFFRSTGAGFRPTEFGVRWSSNFGHINRFLRCHFPLVDGGRQIAQC